MASEGLRVASVKRRAKFSVKNKQMAPWPSRGGIGSKLKSASRRFSENMMLRRIATPSRCPGCSRGDHSRKSGRFRRRQRAGENSNANRQHRREHQNEVRRRPGQGHPSRATGVSITPVRVEGSAAPADHPSPQDIGENGYDRGAEDFAANVRQRIQRHLPTFRRRQITTPLRGQGMRGFVTGQGKEERNIPEKPQSDEFRIH